MGVAKGAGGGVTRVDVERRHIPDVVAFAERLDLYILPAAGDEGMVDQEIFRDYCLARWSPVASDLPGLSVVPTAAQFLVVHDHEGAVAKRVSPGIDLDAIVVG